MQQTISRVVRGLAGLTMAGLLVQFYLAGVGAFGADSWDMHKTWGYILGIPILLLLILTVIGRLGRNKIGPAVLLVVLFIVQIVLVEIQSDAAWISALHPVNGLALMGLTAALGRPGWNKEAIDSSVGTARNEV